MVVYTEYDSDLKEKVFAVRGAERYTNSTLCSLEYEYYDNHASYLSVDLTASVEHHVGSSTVAFYDNNELIGIKTIKQSQSSVTLNVHTDYAVHLYQAKFLGNAECLSSKSRFVSVEVLEPNLPTPTIVITGVTQQLMTSTSTFNMALTNNGSNLSNKTIKLYVDDEYYGTKTVNGVTSTSITSLTTGKHTIKAVFEGDDEYLANENSFTVMVGYDLDISMNYNRIAVGDTLLIDAYLHNWNGEPISSSTITLVGLDTSATTNSEGYAQLAWEAEGNVTEITVRNNVSNTECSLPMRVIYPNSIDMYTESTIAYDGSDTVISITPLTLAGDILPNCLVNVDGEEYHTGSNGILEYVYTGTGAGKTTITASMGDVSNSIDIEDVSIYWSISKTINWDRISKSASLTLSEMHSGLRLQSPFNSIGTLQLLLSMDITEVLNSNWVWEFVVKSSTVSVTASPTGNILICGVSFNTGELAPNTNVRVEKRGSTVYTYINDTLKGSSSSVPNYIPTLTLNFNNVLIIDTVKLMRLIV